MDAPFFCEKIGGDKALYKASQMYLQYQKEKHDSTSPVIFHLDSRKRDHKLYPFASDFEITFPEPLDRINKIEVISSEFSNSDKTISTWHNSEISWINGNETDLENPIYTTQISYGVYTINTVLTEILSKLNAVPRKLPINGQIVNHSWQYVLSSAPTNGITFYNILYSSTGISANPLATMQDSFVITIMQTNHSCSLGDPIFFQNVDGNPGGIPNSYFNTSFFTVASIVDANTFTILANIAAFTTDTNTGGDNVQIGNVTSFKFLTSPNEIASTKTLLECLGFPSESSVPLMTQLSVNDLRGALKTDSSIFSLRQSAFSGLQLHIGDKFRLLGAEILGLDSSVVFEVTASDQVMITMSINTPISSLNLDDLVINPALVNRLRITSDTSNGNLGMASSQTNIYDTGSTYKCLDLSAEAYCYMVCPQLNQAKQQFNDAGLKNVLTKIQQISQSGYLGFNTVLAYPMIMTTPVNLSTLRLQMYDSSGQPLYLDGLEASFSLSFTIAEPEKPYFLLA